MDAGLGPPKGEELEPQEDVGLGSPICAGLGPLMDLGLGLQEMMAGATNGI